jgi:hypothetical protein
MVVVDTSLQLLLIHTSTNQSVKGMLGVGRPGLRGVLHTVHCLSILHYNTLLMRRHMLHCCSCPSSLAFNHHHYHGARGVNVVRSVGCALDAFNTAGGCEC